MNLDLNLHINISAVSFMQDFPNEYNKFKEEKDAF